MFITLSLINALLFDSVIIGLTVSLFSYTAALGGIYATISMHNHLLDNVMRLPVSFFDITPVGRILNRFSNDVQSLDGTLPALLAAFLRMGTMVNEF